MLIAEVLNPIIPIALEEMDRARLMNRTDTKYVLNAGRIPELLSDIKEKYKVLEINNCRISEYRTTYFDTVDYLFYKQHVIGKPERTKIRYRKYETTGITYLEIKKRTNKNRTVKWRILNEPAADNLINEQGGEFIKGYMSEKNLLLVPVTGNTFKRITLIGNDLRERLTIDFDITFSDLNGTRAFLPALSVIELKRDSLNEKSVMQDALKGHHIRPTGFSKYCIGTALTRGNPYRNILKKKLLLIKK